MNTQDRSQLLKLRVIFYSLAFLTAFYAIFSAVLMTEPGQSLNLPRSWIINYYALNWLFITVNVLMLCGLIWLHRKFKIAHYSFIIFAIIGVGSATFVANNMLYLLFPSEHKNANYVTIEEADKVITDDAVIYALEVNGEAVAYPRKHMEIPHIAGVNLGGEDVVMTFCALSNLAIAYDQHEGLGENSDLGIKIQVHNNLLMVDDNSGELIQQITGETEFSKKKLKEYPSDMMSYASYKKLYPQGKVYIYKFDRKMDNFILGVFEEPMKQQFSPAAGPIFPTLSLSDDRLGQKEQVWGFDWKNEQVAFTKTFMEQQPVFQFVHANTDVVAIYDADLDIISVFEVRDNSVDLSESQDYSFYINSPAFEKLPVDGGIFWMIWSHWYPNTGLLDV